MVLVQKGRFYNLINIYIIILFILTVIFIAIILGKQSLKTQGVVLTVLGAFAFLCERFMLHYFHEYFIKQWYYIHITKITGSNRESIIIPFIFIGMIVYTITQKIFMKIICRR